MTDTPDPPVDPHTGAMVGQVITGQRLCAWPGRTRDLLSRHAEPAIRQLPRKFFNDCGAFDKRAEYEVLVLLRKRGEPEVTGASS